MEVFTVLAGAGDCFIRHAVSGGRPGGGFRPSAAPRRRALPAERAGDTILGRAFVTDGGGVRVAGREIRIAGLDAAEPDREATRRDGDRFGHGKQARSALIREIGGEQVRVSVEGRDAFGRLLGSVTRDGRDIGGWLVREGHAIARGGRYERAEREARETGRGMWAQARDLDPGHGQGWQRNG
ncbi:MAG: thermonuclease family protein [Defluviicoccus sp.]|nr:thermonuclease family protein [Defluviicoccus sp.]